MSINICLLGLSGSGKTCYLYVMSYLLTKGIPINGHRISATSMNRQQQLKLYHGIEQMAAGIWPDGSVDTITYPFELKIDGQSVGDFKVYDYRGGALDGMSDCDVDDSEELFDTFTHSGCIIFLVDGDTLLEALDQQNLELNHRNITFQSQLKARNRINYIESLMNECSRRLNREVPSLLVITKKDILSDKELAAGHKLLKELLPTLFSGHNDMVVGITAVTLGENLHNDHGRLTGGTLCLNTDGNVHIPVLFALFQDLDECPIDIDNAELFPSDRISFYKGGQEALIL